jgi:hypothetical protein
MITQMSFAVQTGAKRVTVHCPRCGRGLCWYRDGVLTLRDNNVMRRPPEVMLEPEAWGGAKRDRFRCGNPRCSYEQVVGFDRLFQRLARAQQAGRTDLTLGDDL